MKMGEIIKKYRKEAGITQEKMAERLGVSAPAVNKWENHHSLPDVALIAPIARLLGIHTDVLLSFEEEMTEKEIKAYFLMIEKKSRKESLKEVFSEVKKKIEEFPNCQKLILNAALYLEGKLMMEGEEEKEELREAILSWYARCLEAEEDGIKKQAAVMLYHHSMEKEEYDKALVYTACLSEENPERKRMEARVKGKHGKKDEAFRAYEELLFMGYHELFVTVNELRALYMKEGNEKMAEKLLSLASALSRIFEMGKYNEICLNLEHAEWKKDVKEVENIRKELLKNIHTLGDFRKSDLYGHMEFSDQNPEFIENLREKIKEAPPI